MESERKNISAAPASPRDHLMPYPLPFLANTRDTEVEREIWREQENASHRSGASLFEQAFPKKVNHSSKTISALLLVAEIN